MEAIRRTISELLARAKHPAVMWSGGKDSQLLLSLVREVRRDVPCLWFRTARTAAQVEFAKRIIRDWDLQVFSYAPADVYCVPNGNDVTLIHEYSFSQHRFPVLIDVEPGERCSLDLESIRMPSISHVWDVILTGLKDSDSHPVLGPRFLPADGYQLGDAQVYSPLRTMTDDEVWGAIRKMNLPVDEKRYAGDSLRDDGTLQLCTACFTSAENQVFCPEEQALIPVHKWDRQASLDSFRKFYALEAA